MARLRFLRSLCWVAWAATGALGHPPTKPAAALVHPTQAQVARRFLVEVLAADYPAAYQRLAPEVRAAVPVATFAAAARPLWQQGQARGAAIELYQLGTRLGNGRRASQWFYRFAFASDSARPPHPPPALLEVSFRDTTARVVLGFGLRRH